MKSLLLRTRYSVKIEIDTQSVLSRPTESFEHVSPSYSTKEWLPLISLDCPPSERNSNPVESGCSDLCEIFLGLFENLSKRETRSASACKEQEREANKTHDPSFVMFCHSVGEIRTELLRESPFIDGVVYSTRRIGVCIERFKHSRNDERLENEPPMRGN